MRSNKGITKIEHTSITEKVANWLRISIIKGDLKSGTKLTEQKVSKLLDVSTTPVRKKTNSAKATPVKKKTSSTKTTPIKKKTTPEKPKQLCPC